MLLKVLLDHYPIVAEDIILHSDQLRYSAEDGSYTHKAEHERLFRYPKFNWERHHCHAEKKHRPVGRDEHIPPPPRH